ncbi:hypothetical protein [Devosia sp. A449]
MSETAINGPGQVALAALSDFKGFTQIGFKHDRLEPETIEIAAVDWHRDRKWSVIRYRSAISDPPSKMMLSAIGRMVSVRSRRRDKTTGELKPVPNGWRMAVKRSFSPMFDRAGSLDVSDGWFDLIVGMADRLWSFEDNHRPKFDDIKSKYAGLRAYHGSDNAVAEAIVETYERLSEYVCETCGAPGRIRGRGWLVTACDAHAPAEKTA